MGKTIGGKLLEKDMLDILGYMVEEKMTGILRINTTAKSLRNIVRQFELSPIFGEHLVMAEWKQLVIMSPYDATWREVEKDILENE